MERRQLLIIHIIFSILLAFMFIKDMILDFGLFMILFLIILAGSTLPFLYWWKHGHERIQQMKFKAIKQFKKRLAEEGVIDETEDIARAKKLPWVTDETIDLELSLVKDFVEIVNIGERTYAIHRDTLEKLLNKLPINQKEVPKLSDAEQRVLDIILAAGMVVQEENSITRKNVNKE